MRNLYSGFFQILFAFSICGCKDGDDAGTVTVPEGAPIRIDRDLPRSNANHEYEDLLTERINEAYRRLLNDYITANDNPAQVDQAIDNNKQELSAIEKEMDSRFPSEKSKTKGFIEIWRGNLMHFQLNVSPSHHLETRAGPSSLSADVDPNHKQELLRGILKTSEKVTQSWPLIYVDSGLWDASLEARVSEVELLHVRMHLKYPKRQAETRRMIDGAKKRIRGLKVGPNWKIGTTNGSN